MTKKLIESIRAQSEKIATLLGARDICRIDYRINLSSGEFYFIEINSAPRFSSTSEIGFIAQKKGMHFKDITKLFIETVNKRLFPK